MFVLIFSSGVGAFLTLLINLSFPTLGNLIKKFQNLSNPHPLPALPPHGVYLDRCIKKTHKNPNLEEWDKSQSGNLLGNPPVALVSLCQIWDFYGYSLNTLKYPKMGICYFFQCHADRVIIGLPRLLPRGQGQPSRIWKVQCDWLSLGKECCSRLSRNLRGGTKYELP